MPPFSDFTCGPEVKFSSSVKSPEATALALQLASQAEALVNADRANFSVHKVIVKPNGEIQVIGKGEPGAVKRIDEQILHIYTNESRWQRIGDGHVLVRAEHAKGLEPDIVLHLKPLTSPPEDFRK